MKYVSTHLTWHHARHAPLHFFAALILSPIHAAEMHYKKRYALNYVHAKKLFIFDIGLILFTLAIFAGTVSWWLYNPGPDDLVATKLFTQNSRLDSGDHISLFISVHNRHDYALDNTAITVDLPPTFILDEDTTNTLSLGTIHAYETREVAVTGYFYGAPNTDYRFLAHTSYEPPTTHKREEKINPLTLRPLGSVLEMTLTAPTSIIPENGVPVSVQLTNTGEQTLHDIYIPFFDNVSHDAPLTNTGTTTDKYWHLPTLAEHSTATIYFAITAPDSVTDQITLQTTSTIRVHDTTLIQNIASQSMNVVRPQIELQTTWQNTDPITPGTDQSITFSIVNHGTFPIHDVVLSIPLPDAIIDKARIHNNKFTYTNSTITLASSTDAELSTLPAGSKFTRTLSIPILSVPIGSENISFTPTIRLEATTPLVPNIRLVQNARGITRAIGSTLTLQPEVRYFTNEGDQLGRGPLPPQVGKTTKYLTIVTLTNNTNEVSNILVRTKLAPTIVWTGKKSVSVGKDMILDADSHTLSWRINSLAPHEQAVASFEISLTPTETMRATTPVLIEQIDVSGHDEFTNQTIFDTTKPLTAAISSDSLGAAFGTRVQ